MSKYRPPPAVFIAQSDHATRVINTTVSTFHDQHTHEITKSSNIMVRVDDTELARWNYADGGNGWRRRLDPQTFNLSGHAGLNNGSLVTIHFHGTSVQLVGYILPLSSNDGTPIPRLSFSLDNVSSTYTPPINVQATLYNQTFFTSNALPDERHDLTVIYTQTNPSPSLWLDYIDYTPGRLHSENVLSGTPAIQPSSTNQPSPGHGTSASNHDTPSEASKLPSDPSSDFFGGGGEQAVSDHSP
ncbi:hypothetical protein V5O48_009868 [Marasmius crinis-equi]|uniref:Uncharacterized protein n=1 Tax=Marasmius crinis-equi TaxID=585013 RepID=A0ABR3F9W6_9AGAR